MRIILKPLGALAIFGAIIGLTLMLVLRPAGKTVASVAPAPAASPSPAASAPSGPDPAGRIYDDQLQNGWVNFSWTKEADLQESTLPAKEGNSCIRVTTAEFQALYFHHEPINTAAYDRLTFWIHGGKTGKQKLRVAALCAGKKPDGTPQDNPQPEVVLPPLVANKWQRITLSLRRLNVADKNDVVGFWIQEGVGNKTNPPYYVDDVRLLHPGESDETIKNLASK